VFEALDTHGDEARLIAGGQSLVPALNMRLLEPRVLIDINGLAELQGVSERDGMLHIGALTRHAELGRSPLVARAAPLLHRAVPHIAHAAIRNRGTIGGSLAFADPAAELPACVVALGGTLETISRRGTRRIPAGDFFKGLYETALAPDELIAAVLVPVAPPGTATAFLELARRRGDYAMVGLAAQARLDDGVARDLSLVFFGVDTRPVSALAAVRALEGKPLLAQAAAAQAALAEDLDPPEDLHGSGATKLHLARVLLGRALRALVEDGARRA
jgi:carbon-monoxide dehydrogenase medium subunit